MTRPNGTELRMSNTKSMTFQADFFGFAMDDCAVAMMQCYFLKRVFGWTFLLDGAECTNYERAGATTLCAGLISLPARIRADNADSSCCAELAQFQRRLLAEAGNEKSNILQTL